MKNDKNTNIQELKDALEDFRNERGWGSSRTPRNLAVSIAVEAAELLEHFQWGEYDKKQKEALANELADIVHYCVEFATTLDIDISTASRAKLEHLKKKYPVELFKPGQPNSEAYFRIKQAYRKGKKQ